MANYPGVTKRAVLRKINRRRNPVTSGLQLAREFGIDTTTYRWDGTIDNTVPPSFRDHVKSLVGEDVWNRQIRQSKYVNYHAR